jgi:beta-lactamase superfamily II metal-dependent hydrolase
MMTIKFLPANYGDCIWISFKDEQNTVKNILIDGGTTETYLIDKNSKGKAEHGALKVLADELRAKEQLIDLLIITHVDDDHIGGILKWFEEDAEAHLLLGEVWFNSGKLIAEELKKKENLDLCHPLRFSEGQQTSIVQGIEFYQYLTDYGKQPRRIISQGQVLKRFGLTFKILSPNLPKLELLLKHWRKKDPDLKTGTALDDYGISLRQHIAQDSYTQDGAYPNGSSIAFIIVYGGKNLLFLGDSHPSVIVKGLKIFDYTPLKPLKAAIVKLSHHGSKGNNSKKLLDCMESDTFVISTDGTVNQHPHKQMLARLINMKRNIRLVFNYQDRMDAVFSETDKLDFPDFNIACEPNGITLNHE